MRRQKKGGEEGGRRSSVPPVHDAVPCSSRLGFRRSGQCEPCLGPGPDLWPCEEGRLRELRAAVNDSWGWASWYGVLVAAASSRSLRCN